MRTCRSKPGRVQSDVLATIDAPDRVIAHSFGASILLGVLAENGPRPLRAALLAMPDWSRQFHGLIGALAQESAVAS